MEMKTIKCAACGKSMNVNEGVEFYYCPFCGTKLKEDLPGVKSGSFADKLQREPIHKLTRWQEYKAGQVICRYQEGCQKAARDGNKSLKWEDYLAMPPGDDDLYGLTERDELRRDYHHYESPQSLQQYIPDVKEYIQSEISKLGFKYVSVEIEVREWTRDVKKLGLVPVKEHVLWGLRITIFCTWD